MKCIIIGLGNFGMALAQRLTAMGYEVIGVDKDIDKVNAQKAGHAGTLDPSASGVLPIALGEALRQTGHFSKLSV